MLHTRRVFGVLWKHFHCCLCPFHLAGFCYSCICFAFGVCLGCVCICYLSRPSLCYCNLTVVDVSCGNKLRAHVSSNWHVNIHIMCSFCFILWNTNILNSKLLISQRLHTTIVCWQLSEKARDLNTEISNLAQHVIGGTACWRYSSSQCLLLFSDSFR